MHIACKKRAAVKKTKGKSRSYKGFRPGKDLRCGFQCTLDRGSWVTLYMLARLVNKATLDSKFLDNIDMAEVKYQHCTAPFSDLSPDDKH